MSRWTIILLGFAAINSLFGCHGRSMEKVHTSVRTTLTLHSAPEDIRGLTVALLPITVVPTRGAFLHIFPDEAAYVEADYWIFVPNESLIPPTDILLLSLRNAGLSVQSRPTLSTAKSTGDRIALVGVMRKGHVKIPDIPMTGGIRENGVRMASVEAVAEFELAMVDLQTFSTLWEGTISAIATDVFQTPFDSDYARIKYEAGLGSMEPEIHPMRVLVTQCYHDIAMKIVQRLVKTHPRRISS